MKIPERIKECLKVIRSPNNLGYNKFLAEICSKNNKVLLIVSEQSLKRYLREIYPDLNCMTALEYLEHKPQGTIVYDTGVLNHIAKLIEESIKDI